MTGLTEGEINFCNYYNDILIYQFSLTNLYECISLLDDKYYFDIKNKIYNMTGPEIDFIVYWETVVKPNKNNIHSSMINHCSHLLGKTFQMTCNSCLHNAAVDLNNLYERLLPYYKEYKEEMMRKNAKEVQKEQEVIERNNTMELKSFVNDFFEEAESGKPLVRKNNKKK